jgi:dTDP-glucose 4,6-dehydratase
MTDTPVVLVTGAAGFIGSTFVRHCLEWYPDSLIVCLDKAPSEQWFLNLDFKGARGLYMSGKVPTPRIKHESREAGRGVDFVGIRGDISNFDLVTEILQKLKPQRVVNFAAESHVDRSIDGPTEFWQNNVMAMEAFLRACVEYGELRQFVQVSTDEVYGDRTPSSQAIEDSPHHPSSPYAASKVAQEAMLLAYSRTYRHLPYLITRCSNNYGPHQAPEKLIPLMIAKAMAGEPLPVYGDGQQKRDWIHVSDHCAAISHLMDNVSRFNVFNIGSGELRTNMSVVENIITALEMIGGFPEATIENVADRPGHDRCYSISVETLAERGWSAPTKFTTGLAETVKWYVENSEWIEKAKQLGFSTDRVGLRK